MLNFTHQTNKATLHFFLFLAKKSSLPGKIANNFCCFLVFLFSAQTILAQKPENKIDPVFRALLAQKNLPPSERRVAPTFFIQPTKGFASKDAAVEERYNCIVYTTNAQALKDSGIVVNSALPKLATAWVTLEQLEKLASYPNVQYIRAPHENHLYNDVTVSGSGAALLHAGKLNNTVYKGKGVIVAVYDSGIDWKHPDFRNATDQTKSRILRLWDQTITAGTGEAPPAGFSYGVEYTQAQINDEIDGTPAGFVREKDVNGHGTHVAGTAAGNGSALATKQYTGMAPEADLIIIKGGNGSFPTSNTIDAITYLKGLANTLGKPIVLNMSIGGQFGPHDGTEPDEVAVDDFTASGSGRAVVISAGNDNGTNLHNRLTLAAGASGTVSFTVPSGTTGTDVFQFTTWANGNGNVSATVTAPVSNETVTANAGQSASGLVLTNNFTVYLDNFIDPANGNRYVNFYLARNGSNTGDPAGTWTLTITNNSATTLVLDGWLNYKGTSFGNTVIVGGDNNNLVGSPGNATSAITVASFVGRLAWYSSATPGAFNYTAPTQQDNISTFSSIGPRRDGLQKPDITANGQGVISCLSSDATEANSDIVVSGLYFKNQGTSMSAPGVTGAVALLLQAKPAATAVEVKNLLTSNAITDALTGAVPNATWGYGKMNVYKAAASIFNCSPSNWKMYQYDNSFTSAQNLGVLVSSQRLAVRFTPDMTGKLGGFYYHTAATTSVTDLVAEVRTNNAGAPGTLLGTINIPVAKVAKYSWNYVDLTSLNLSVTNGTDYFVVLFRDPSSVSNWSITRENTSLDNRTVLSSDGGATWSLQAYDYRIRSVVYSNPEFTNALANVNTSETRDINTSNQFLYNCNLISQLVPNGASPVSGTVTSKVWIESSVPTYHGSPYVARHFETTPAANAGTATGRVTLYFTQAEFDAFNAAAGSTLDLPANPSDAAGKANLKVVKFAGTSSDGTGLPSTYTGSALIIDPNDADIVWNSEASRWEVSFDVTGFSGFIVVTNLSVLPVTLEYFTGKKTTAGNVLDWKASCSDGATALFEVQRSADSRSFSTIGNVAANQVNCGAPLQHTDAAPLAGNNFYRIKITEVGGNVRYSNILLLQDAQSTVSVYPTIVAKGASVQVTYPGTKGTFVLSDATGKKVLQDQSLRSGVQTVNINTINGMYFYSIKNESGNTIATGRIVVQ